MAEGERITVELVVTSSGLELFDQAGKKVGEFKTSTEGAAKATGVFEDILKGIREGFEQEISAAERAAKQNQNLESSFTSLAARVIGLNQALELASKAANAAGTAFDFMFAGLERGAAINDLSQRLGVSVETISKLELAASTTGVSLEGLATGVQQLSRQMSNAAAGSKEAEDAFAAVGIAASELTKLSTEEVLLRIADAFARSENDAGKTAVAMQLLGRSGATMIPLLNEGAKGLERFADISERLGLTLSQEVSDAMDAIGDSMEILGAAVQGVQNQLAIGMAPALARAAEEMVDLATSLGIGEGGLQRFGEAVGEWIADTLGEAGQIIRNFQQEIERIGFGEALANALNASIDVVVAKAADVGVQIGGAIVEGVAKEMAATFTTKLWSIIVEAAKFARDEFNRVTEEELAAGSGRAPGDLLTPGARARVEALGIATSQAIEDFNAAVEKAKAAGQPFLKLTDDLGASFVTLATKVPPATVAVASDASTKDRSTKSTIALSAATREASTQTDELAKRFASSVDSLLASIDATEAQAEALQLVLDAGLSAEEAQGLLNNALQRTAEEAALAAGHTQAEAEMLGLLARASTEAQQRVAELNRELQAQRQIDALRFEAGQLQQVLAGTKELAAAEREIAIQREVANGLSRERAAQLVDERQRVAELRKEFQALGDTGVSVGQMIGDSFTETLRAIASGTQEVGEIWESFGINLAASLFDNLYKEKLNFDELFKVNLLDLVDWAAKLFSGGAINIGGLFSFGGGGAGLLGGGSLFGSGGGGLLDLFGLGSSGFNIGSLLTGTGLGSLFGGGSTLQLANSIFGPTFMNSALDLLASVGFIGQEGSAAFAQWLANTPALSFLGGAASAAGAGYGAFNLAQGNVDAGSILGTVGGIAGSAAAFGPIGAIVGAIVAAIGAIVGALVDVTPTEGTLRRRGGESALTSIPTFAALEEQLGDITRSRYRLRDNPDLPRQREKLGPDALLDVSGFAGIFAQLAFGGEDGGKLVAGIVEEWTNILTDFFSRMEGDSAEVSIAIRQNLAQAFREMGVDAADAMGIINDLAQNLLTSPDPTYFGEAVSNVTNLGETIRGTAAIFESELPRGVHIAALALETMRKDGVAAFTDLSKEGRQNLLDLTRDAEAFDQVVAMLFADGFQINTDEFKTRLADITASAEFIGQSIGAVFTGPSVAAGIEAMGQQLRELVTNSFRDEALGQLFDTTNIAASFEPVFAVLRQLKDGAFDLTSATGLADFKNQIAVAIAEGRANLDEFIPQLRAIRDAARDLDELIEEALKPSDVEAFWLYLEEQFKANKEAVEGMAASLFEVAAAAEMVVPGSGRDAARAAIDQQIDQTAFSAVQAAAGEFAVKSPQGEALAALTTEFQAKVAAAFQDGVITAEEKLELAQLKQKMDEAGQVLADSVSGASAELADLFEADRLKELTEQASAALKSSVGSAADSMFDVIAKGGSTGEGIQAFAESFRSSVRENVLQGMQEALVQSVLLESALAPLMAAMKDGMAKALEDGIITADEQAWLDAIAKGIHETTDSTIAALTPTLETLGGIAQTVAGNTETANVKITELDRQTRQVDGAVSEMARRAARNLEQVGDAVSEDVTGGIKEGLATLSTAIGGDVTGGIKEGLATLSTAIGGTPEEIRAGLQALRDAFGPDASPAEIEAGLLKMQSALGNELIDPIARGIDTLRDALGNTNAGAASAASDLATAMREALRPAATEVAGVLQDDLQSATENVAASLRDQFAGGLNAAEDAVRRFAERLNSVLRGSSLAPPADPPPADPVPGAAMGGTFASGAAVVGEAGRPELVIARPGGGFEVIPLDHATAFALMRGGIPGFAAGGAIPPGTRQRPGPGSGWGPDGPWVTDPNDPRHPDYIRPAAEGEALKVQIEIRSQLEEYFQSGDFAAFTEQWERSVNEAIAKGILDAILETGPIARGMERLNAVLSREIEKAWRDGSLTDDEIARIKERAAELGAPIVETVRKLGPELQGLFADLGLGESVASDLRGALEGAFRTFATGGSVDDLRQSIHEAFREATINGIIDGLLLEGPIAEAIAGVSEGFHAALSAAMEDGIISEEEAANLQALAAGLGTHLEQVFAGLDPAITALFEGMRNRAAEAAAQAGELITGAFRSIINDPEKLNFESFSQTLRTSLYQTIAGGLIDAFMDAAIVQGALAPMLQAIQEIFDQIGQKQLSIAEANGLIAEQIAAINGVLEDPTFKSAIDELLKGIGDIGTNLNAFPPRAAEVAAAAVDVSDALNEAQEDVCDGKCELRKELVEMGATALDEFGRAGTQSIERWIPAFGKGGIVRRPTVALVGESGPEIIVPLEALENATRGLMADSALDRIAETRAALEAFTLQPASDSIQAALASLASRSTRGDLADSLREALARREPAGTETSETTGLLRELISELRNARESGARNDQSAALERLASALASQPIVVEISGRQIARAVREEGRFEGRGGRTLEI